MRNSLALKMATVLAASCLLSALSACAFPDNGCPSGLSGKGYTDSKALNTAGQTCKLPKPSFIGEDYSITATITCDRTGGTCLPQDDSDEGKQERADSLEESRESYQWYFEGPPVGVPYLEGVPVTELPDLDWIMQVFNTLVNINISLSRDPLLSPGEIVDLVSDITTGNTDNIGPAIANYSDSVTNTTDKERATNISDYEAMHGFPLQKPESVFDYDDDDVFVRYRLQGVNPITIKKCTQETRGKLKSLDSGNPEYQDLQETVDSLMEDGRLFVVDHELLAGMDATPVDGYDRYLSMGIALFEYEAGDLADKYLPLKIIGIQLSQGDSDDIPPIFTPDDDEGGSWTWMIAKTCFEAADYIIHEVVSHLGFTHILMEGVVVALHRQLAKEHPIYTLMHPHLEGIALINWGAQNILLLPGGEVDRLQANNITDSWDLVLNETLKRMSSDFSPPTDFANRGMTEDDFPDRYAYRDYGLKYWDAILTWVTEYLHLYYMSDDDVAADYELQAFVDEMIENAQMTWFSELKDADDKKGLIAKIFASLIYTTSVHHAAVNFPQRTAVSFVPSSGVSMFQHIPTDKSFRSYEDYMDYLPPMKIAYEHVETLTLLGSIYYTKLGDYQASQFDDDRVVIPLSRFRQAIEVIEAEMVADNEKVFSHFVLRGKDVIRASNFAYKTLLPDNVPQSINI